MRKKDFEQFYTAHFDKIYRFVFFRTGGDRELAEDLVEEIFLKALENFGQYDPDRGRSAWIFTIAKNHIANHWRDNKPVAPLPEVADEDGEDLENVWLESALAEFKKNGIQHQVGELLGNLDDKSGQIVTLHYIFGYNYSEVAEMVKMTETAVKVAAHRAIKKLAEYL